MGGKYEVRYYLPGNVDDFPNYLTEYTNSFVRFLKLMVTKKVIYFKIICKG